MDKVYVLAKTSNKAASDIVGKLVFVQRHIETNMARLVDYKTNKPIWMTSKVVNVNKRDGISLELNTLNSTYFFVEINK